MNAPAIAHDTASHDTFGAPAASIVTTWPRAILCLVLGNFYASAEEARKHALGGVPLAVTGVGGERGTVVSVSTSAQQFGVRVGMPLIEAQRRCPSLVAVAHDAAYYAALFRRFLDLLRGVTSAVQTVGADAALLDLTGLPQTPEMIAVTVRRRVHVELGLTVSVGLATGRTTAQVAAHSAQANAVCIVRPGSEARFLAPLPVAAMPGIGPTTRRALASLHIETLGQLAARTDRTLYKAFGERGLTLARRARGVDEDTPEVVGRVTKAIGHTRTLAKPTKEREILHATLAALCDDTAAELRHQGLTARQVTLRVRRADYRSTTLRRVINPGTDAGQRLLTVVANMLEPCLRELNNGRVRQLNVRVTRLTDGGQQLPLWDAREEARYRAANAALDAVRARYGKAAMRPAVTLLAAAEASPDAAFMP